MSKLWSKEDLSSAAFTISGLIEGCPTEQRGDLLKLVADRLADKTQYYTAKLIKDAASIYGVSR